MRNSVIVSTGYGRLHLYNAAVAAQQAGLLRYLITSMYPGKKLHRLTEYLSNITGKNTFKRLLCCHDERLEESKIISLPSTELVSRLSKFICRRGVKENLCFRLERLESVYYGRRANNYIQPGVKLIHARSGYCRAILPHAHSIGAKILLEQSAAHPKFVRNIMQDEYEKWGIAEKHRRYISPAKEMEWDIAHADYILTNSDFCAGTIKPYVRYPENIRVVYTGVDVNAFGPMEKDKRSEFRILYLSALTTNKGIGYLISAFKKLRLTNTRLRIVGFRSIDTPKIFDECGSLFEYSPVICRSEVINLMAQADVFVLPSLAEGSARVVAEAMASGTTCIVTNNCGSVIQDGYDGYIVPPQNADAIAEKILYLYQNRDACREMGHRARRKAVNSLSWQHYQQNLLRVYKDIQCYMGNPSKQKLVGL